MIKPSGFFLRFFTTLVDNKPVAIINASYEWHFDASYFGKLFEVGSAK